jgi:hypothetical protein
MKNSLLLCFTAVLLSFSHDLFSQKSPARVGRLDKHELELDYTTGYPDAEALVLFDYGNIYFNYNQLTGFQVVFEKHIRIKILNKDGLKWGDREVTLYRQGNSKEFLTNLTGYTYYLEGGRLIRDKLESDAIFRDETSTNFTDVRFVLPNVTEGSIIEYSYTLTSDFYSLPSWFFQKSIPVLYSELNVKIPEYFRYKTLMKGYEPLDSYDTKNVNQMILAGPGNNITATATSHKWVSYNVPAFIEEPYLTAASDFMSGVDFELSSINFPGQFTRNITASWEGITKNLNEGEDFGRQLRRGNFLRPLSDSIKEGSEKERMIQAHKIIQEKMLWNGRNRWYVTKTLRNAHDEGTGSSADINMMLVLLLREIGLEAYPVIISTRSNGMIHPARIMLSQFNYVIAHVKADDNEYLLDATDKNCPWFLLPMRCLNGQGRIIKENFSDWVDLNKGQEFQSQSYTTLAFDDENDLTGKIHNRARNHAAYQKKSRLENDTDYKKYISGVEEGYPGLKVLDYQVENLEDMSQGLRETFEVRYSGILQTTGDLIIFNPMLHERRNSNPFRLEDRKYPVDYGVPVDESCHFIFEVPDGYEIDELPANTRVALPGDAGFFTYQVSVVMNKIQVLSRFQINQTVFVYSDYKNLKEFYDLIVNKHAEQVVLKKI